jgi:hypothetical protein
VTLACRQTGGALETSFFVQGLAQERLGKPARPEVLEEISRITRGKVLALNRLEEVVQTLGNLPDPPPVERRLQLWSHPAVMAAMVALLTLFWILRKWVGLF